MRRIRYGLVAFIATIAALQPTTATLATGDRPARATHAPGDAQPTGHNPRELSGYLDDKSADHRARKLSRGAPGMGEDGLPMPPPPLAGLPVIDEALAARTRAATPGEMMRVIIYLDYLPHARVLAEVLDRHAAEVEALEADRGAIIAAANARRVRGAVTDAENYAAMLQRTNDERERLTELAQRNEALSAVIKNEVSTELRALIGTSQKPVLARIAALGGNVEFTTLAGNTVIARLPAGAVDRLAKVKGVMRIAADGRIESNLTTADDATMVDPEDTSLLGLWDNGLDGGAYDPATIDSGVDQDHPGMADAGNRTNYCSWYLVAANGDSDFADSFDCDDRQGHGTHVAGIVGSYGSTGYSTHLGMSFGVAKMVNLKAGWLNSSTGGASMYWSDKYNLVDRALYNISQLMPNTFGDDVDGMNLSYSGSTTADDTDGGRFWDSVISSYPDLPVTISAGNTGPSNANFNDPAVSYNAITVANYSDRGTADRDDDVINSSSSVGPTASNRRKPDIAAPGTSITAPNHLWESQADYVAKSGTSMSAPMVLGVIMDLADAGVFDELAVKALLINTAQKNLPGMDIENDADGWDPALGWGAMNAYAAYFHRGDVFIDSVAPRGTAGDFQLYKGAMRDEGATGEGRDRATMVWNRVATYDSAAAPSTYYDLVDLNLRLYREDNNALIDTDFDGNDNVHQVRIDAGAPETEVVINAYAWSSSFSHGGATQGFALAAEDGFAPVDHPADFQGIASWPTSVEPNEVFDVEFWLRNNSEIASHNNVFDLELPPGWTLVSGADTQGVGSVAGGGGTTTHVIYTLRAPNSEAGAQTIVVAHSHNSYNEPYGDYNWNMGLTVEYDSTPPEPNPMSFSTLPHDTATTTIEMTASFATDIHTPVEYYLDYTSSPTGGTGGSDSGWQPSRLHSDTGLQTNDQYCYRAWARDNAASPNNTTPSAIECAYTSQATPAGVVFGVVTATSIEAASSSIPPNLGLGSSGLRINNTTAATDSGWKQHNGFWNSLGLSPAAPYVFAAQARNGDGDETINSPPSQRYTLANPPAVDSLTTASASQIDVVLHPNGNSGFAEYFIQNTTAGTDSGWIGSTSWSSTALTCETSYNFQARARNGDGIETIIVGLGSQSTGSCESDADLDGVPDSADNCTLVANADQRDTDGDGYGNICDADFDNNGIVNSFDLSVMRTDFGASGDLHTDLDGNGIVNSFDLSRLRSYFGAPPGPSGVATP